MSNPILELRKRGRPLKAETTINTMPDTKPKVIKSMSMDLHKEQNNSKMAKMREARDKLASQPPPANKTCSSCRKPKDIADFGKSGVYFKKTCKTCDSALKGVRKSLRNPVMPTNQ